MNSPCVSILCPTKRGELFQLLYLQILCLNRELYLLLSLSNNSLNYFFTKTFLLCLCATTLKSVIRSLLRLGFLKTFKSDFLKYWIFKKPLKLDGPSKVHSLCRTIVSSKR